MTYKVITLSQGKIAVDEAAEIKEGDWYIDDTNQIRFSIISDKHYWIERTNYFKIIASTYFINKSIPMWKEENEIEKIANEIGKNKFWEGNSIFHKDSFIEGYKAAQSCTVSCTMDDYHLLQLSKLRDDIEFEITKNETEQEMGCSSIRKDGILSEKKAFTKALELLGNLNKKKDE